MPETHYSPEDLERKANALLASPRAKALRRRIELTSFTESEGRSMFAQIPGRSHLKVGFEGGELVPSVDGRGLDFDPAPVIPSVEGADDVLRFILHGGPKTPRAVLTRLASIAHAAQIIDEQEVMNLAGCSRRTLQRQTKKCRGST